MAEIAVVAPYGDLAIISREIARSLGFPLAVEVALLREAIDVAHRLKAEGAKVLVSRGGTALVLQRDEELALPVVEIPVTAYDLVRALVKARRIDNRIGIIGFENMIMGAATLEDALGVEIEEFLLTGEDEAENRLRQAAEMGIKVVVGGVITARLGQQYGIKSIMVESGPEGIRQAIEEAKRVLWVRKQEDMKTEQFRLILDNVSDGIIAIDEAGRVTVFNSAAEKLTGLRACEVLGRPIGDPLPHMGALRVLRTGRSEIGEVSSLNNTPVTMNRIPIMLQESCVGVVVTFQEVSKLQSLERSVRKKLHARGHVARFSFGDIVGKSNLIRSTVAKAKRFAEGDSTVLIIGETGVGKELFAQSMHNLSPRKDGPFVAVNCAALPDELLESELFGYVEGAFTGARKGGKIGLFELAHGGTLFLDEIGRMSLRLQSRLLRVLQEKEVMRLGDDRVIPVDVRVIAASNRDLRELLETGSFQKDLYYRLDVLRLVIPPLRERREDIPLLAVYFLQEYFRRNGRGPKKFSGRALELLSSYDWPGNVRELQNIIERIAVICDSELVEESTVIEALEGDIEGSKIEGGRFGRHAGGSAGGSILLKRSIAAAEREVILKALQRTGGNKTRAAKELGIDRTTLWRKLRGS